MSYALALIGFLGFFITNIYMIIQAVKKKFRKKLLLPPLICFILFIIGASLMPSSTKVAIKTIQISLENQETEYDINQTIPVSISVEPSDADISDLTYISSAGKSDTFTFTDNKIETGTAEGSYEIYVKCGDIESNKLSITVVDVAARKAAQEQAELETQKQAELEAQEEAQKQAELEAQQKAQEEAQKQAELEAQQKAQEEAQKQAELEAQQQAQEEAAAAQTQQNTTTYSSDTSDSQQNTGGTVYWTPNGEVYHSTKDCPSLGRSKTILSGSISESGKSRPCKNCY
ncbi:cell envelope integrity protein TolA [Eubacterium ramulus]|jgi:colicin import membrane protein|uniref:cell envelope integrity protein TolA n=1 Tax=Eubacterium ramulus TaxID=39490 RepID=UPI000D6465FB|nr:cell envelope integrity protein TolA [Eubacterium ramulus]